MESAARSCYAWIETHFSREQPLLVLCGMGNNGGDGLALSRMLIQEGFKVEVLVLRHRDNFTPDTSENLRLLTPLLDAGIRVLEPGARLMEVPEDYILIDALLGLGLSRSVSGWMADFIFGLNQLPNTRISIDLPSGLPADNLPRPEDIVFKADFTLSFQFYKRSFLHEEGASYCGKIVLLDIGLDARYIDEVNTGCFYTDGALVKELHLPRPDFGHKGTFGTAVLCGGSKGKMGAVMLAAQAALRAGAGKVWALIPACGTDILQIGAPEVMVHLSGEEAVEDMAFPEDVQAMGIGPGLGIGPLAAKALHKLIIAGRRSLVLDADALNLLAGKKDLLYQLPALCILTPHIREFGRMFGDSGDSMQRVELARHKAMKHNCIIVLKGRHTCVALPDGSCYYNSSGNSGMATAGSGDVLTGVITGLLAQGYTPRAAAISGVYLHGLAGDIAAEKSAPESLIAGDILRYLGNAFREINP